MPEQKKEMNDKITNVNTVGHPDKSESLTCRLKRKLAIMIN